MRKYALKRPLSRVKAYFGAKLILSCHLRSAAAGKAALAIFKEYLSAEDSSRSREGAGLGMLGEERG